MNRHFLPTRIIVALLLSVSACNHSATPSRPTSIPVPTNTPARVLREAIVLSADDGTGNTEIFLIEDYGSDPVILTMPPKDAGHSMSFDYPEWSPDGTHIAFSSNLDDEGHSLKIYVMERDGSNVTLLTDGGCEYAPAWSPDGMHIAFVSCGETSPEISVIDADGSNTTRLTYDGIVASKPTWSPDGRYIAFVGNNSDGTDSIYVMDADGSNATRLEETTTPLGVSVKSPAWSPDGTRIAYIAAENIAAGRSQVLTFDVSGSTGVRAIAGREQDLSGLTSLVWSPDGKRIMVLVDIKTGLQVMDADGSNRTNPIVSNASLFRVFYLGRSADWFMPGIEPMNVTVERPTTNLADDQLATDLKGICVGGEALPAMPAYTPGAGPHPIAAFVLQSQSQNWQNAMYPVLRLPHYTTDEVQLVACIQHAVEYVEACNYVSNTGTIERTVRRGQHHSIIDVFEARSGTLVVSFDIPGPSPKACPPALGVYESSPDLNGGPVSDEVIGLKLDGLYYGR